MLLYSIAIMHLTVFFSYYNHEKMKEDSGAIFPSVTASGHTVYTLPSVGMFTSVALYSSISAANAPSWLNMTHPGFPQNHPTPACSPSFVLSHLFRSYRQHIANLIRHLSFGVARSCSQQVKAKAVTPSLLPFGHIKPRPGPRLLPSSTALCRFFLNVL